MQILRFLTGNLVSGKFARFLGVGALNYAFIVSSTYFLTEYLGFFYFYAYVAAYAASVSITYAFLRRWVFDAPEKAPGRLGRYLFYLTLFTAANWICVRVLTERLGVFYLVSVVAVPASLFVVKFLTYKHDVFGQPGQ
jgi:putative flippase GtrA